MRYRRARATLCSLVLLTVLAGLSMTGPGPTPVAAQQATVFTTGEGLSNDLLKGWQRVQLQGQIAGRYSAVLTAPLCSSQNSVGCQSDGATTAHLISLTVERASSEATATGDELPATLDQLAFTRTAATVDGQPAIRFTAPNPDQYFSQVVVLEVEGVYYHLAFSASFQAVPQLVDQILAGFTLRPAEAPAPFIASGNTSPTPTPDPGLVNQYTVFLPTVSYANTPVQTQPAGSPASRFTVAQATGTAFRGCLTVNSLPNWQPPTGRSIQTLGTIITTQPLMAHTSLTACCEPLVCRAHAVMAPAIAISGWQISIPLLWVRVPSR
ncbi:MAG: hypothetical protein WCP31_02630 [Chloroflexales bacterium]